MSDDLYFIPLIVRALKQPGPAEALQAAFAEIQRLGQQTKYAQGHKQFQMFMAAASQSPREASRDREALIQIIVKKLIDDLTRGTFGGDASAQTAALELIGSRREWQEEHQQAIRDGSDESISSARFAVLLEGETTEVRALEFSSSGGVGSFGDILPGRYTLSLDTGLLLWQGIFTESDLIWREAFPGEPLEMAAATDDLAQRSTVDEPLLEGELRMRAFPGIECGRIEIELRPF